MAVIAKQRYKLDIAPRGGWVIVYASQHDDGAREIEFEITNQGKTFSIPASINVSVQGIKANKSYFSHSCSYSGNVVTMALADDMTDIVGKAICVLKFTNSSNQKLATAKFVLNIDTDSSSEGVIIDTDAEEIFNQMLNEIRAQASAISADIAELQSMVGSPLVASTASVMTDHNKIYVYVGSESGYTNGNWYYWNGSTWTSGGVYNSTAFETDKTLSVENMPADAKSVGDKIGDVNSEINELKTDLGESIVIINRFDKTKAVTGRITNNGVDTSLTDEFTSDYTNVNDIDEIIIGRWVNGVLVITNSYYVLYDESKNRIGSRSIGSTIDTSQASYIRFTGRTNSIGVFMLFSSDYTPTQYVPYLRDVSFSYVDNKINEEGANKYTKGRIGEISEENTSFFDFSENRLDLTKVIANKQLDSSGNVIDSDTNDLSDYCYIGDFSTVYLGRFVSVIIYGTFSQYCILYDADKNKISNRIAIPTTGLDISSYNATFIRCNLPHDRNYPVVLVSSAPSIYEQFGYKFKYQPKDPLYGKKWAVCGDSFTWGGYSPMNLFTDGICYGKRKVYPYFIRQRTGIEIYDFSLGGRTLAYPPDGTFENSLTNPSADYYYQNIPADCDYITIYLGINDFGHKDGYGQTQDGEDATGVIELGTINDDTTGTYYGAWNVVLTWLITNRPFAHIGIIVTNGTQNQQYTEAQINIAKKYGIPYLNMNGDERTPAMIRCYNPNIPASIKTAILEKQRVSLSNTHPNDDTHEFESHFIEAWLRTL